MLFKNENQVQNLRFTDNIDYLMSFKNENQVQNK